ncbi:MAG: membrane integrity-associated transporter subunit PqiC [Thiobacillus sp.]|nr:membrane integrity-associated transporter subunit PqiC [Thiobacillus sp.]
MLALAGGLLGCQAAAPVRFHTLASPMAAPASPATSAAFLIDVLPVGIPAQLDTAQLLVRQGDSSVVALDGERWIGPFADEARGALSAQLTQRLATTDVAGLAPPEGKPVLRIKVQIRRFDAWPGQQVRLDADWSLGFAHDDYPQVVQAQRHALADLAAQIADSARQWEISRAAPCARPGPGPGPQQPS